MTKLSSFDLDKITQDQSTWSTFKRLWPMITPFKWGIIASVIALIINAVVDGYLISMLKPLIDKGFGTEQRDFLKMMAFIVVGLIFMRGFSSFAATYCLAWVNGKVVMSMRQKVFKHLMFMPVDFFDQNSSGKLLSRITYDSEQIAGASASALQTIVREGAYVIFLMGTMFYYSWRLSLVLLIIGPIIAILVRLISKRFREMSRNMQKSMGSMTESAEQMLRGHKVVLSFGGQKVEEQRFNHTSNDMRRKGMKLMAVSAISNPIIQIIASLALGVVLYLAGSPEIMGNDLTAGEFAAVLASLLAMMRPLKTLTEVNAQFQKGMAACQTLFTLFDLPTEKDNGTHCVTQIKGDICFDDVTFTYSTKNEPALSHLSFNLPAGKTFALVGRSGSGKSTIANLITRFYDIDSGKITLDGIDICDYKLNNLREQCSIVSQQVHLFNDTIANNIAYAAKDKYTQEQIIQAATAAHAMEFIEKMPQGLDSIIGENGVSLSGGQRQRIAIARALLRNSPILVLDEATSALDTESERAIQSALEELQKNRTVLVIAHRLSTIEKADEILVIDQGKIIERGSHSKLIAKNGAYKQLHSLQFEQ
ncbi:MULTISPECIES: lipid A ABC transporter ATP-binding protein/permease MsbA [Pasteurellaceae]|uniref:Lipid A ABC transporter ATP-binding protein/permease MsbA n=1 Tax=Pasteurella atlantica TaxID=2827233 RepID=A0AAW8CJZ9_9PAST|nr:lipid A ABC transporter ATP-binding protein/permease MsbA [Pasteurella atlantica]MBR0574497.1 lipid A ABC transporter ATP-binding protein/permease MsbA [Pasteurella atlantica]MDP8040364.1 lipid A ABC transporter ATP-binding protein/permease MsbA [Pasteurella atlantica]MDP8042415.1 lipid A ABC transporter ATP-binding protein/permease MsbA [Pasteurella atlantica]MDP8044634.1 lipid A ABC transporter ATP-binding protein/permease MsbA [Pasteurella atlantica]MDP8046683.1 lipid A ABC transporter A